MRTCLVAATGLPTLPLTAALVVAVRFWLPAAVGAVLASPGPFTGLPRVVVPALLVAWATACLIVRPLHRLFPDEPAPSVLSEARTDGGIGLRGTGSREPHGLAHRAAVDRPRDSAA
ncbi:hypothetical protein ACWD0Z_11075 [Streptomyces sp. NPDC003007]